MPPPVDSAGIRFAMANPPVDKVCDYQVVAFFGAGIFGSGGLGDTSKLDQARACDTDVVVWIATTDVILQDDGTGLDLAKYEQRLKLVEPYLDPYVADGTIVAHLTIDEPHDCHDWGGPNECPLPSDVDEASRISDQHWPGLTTFVNTSPEYAQRYQWLYTDAISFQYAFHKGPLDEYVAGALATLNGGYIDQIAWGIQASAGGCERYGECPMTPAQVQQVAAQMCSTGVGLYLGFVGYQEDLLTPEMLEAIDWVESYCASPSVGGKADLPWPASAQRAEHRSAGAVSAGGVERRSR